MCVCARSHVGSSLISSSNGPRIGMAVLMYSRTHGREKGLSKGTGCCGIALAQRLASRYGRRWRLGAIHVYLARRQWRLAASGRGPPLGAGAGLPTPAPRMGRYNEVAQRVRRLEGEVESLKAVASSLLTRAEAAAASRTQLRCTGYTRLRSVGDASRSGAKRFRRVCRASVAEDLLGDQQRI